jgi:hypothetical protein
LRAPPIERSCSPEAADGYSAACLGAAGIALAGALLAASLVRSATPAAAAAEIEAEADVPIAACFTP